MSDFIVPILYSIAFINLVFSAVVFSRANIKAFSVLFGLIALGLGFWSVSIIGFYFNDLPFSFNWIALTHSSALFIPLVFCYFSNIFPTPIIRNKIVLSAIPVPFIITLYYLLSGNSIIGKTIGLSYELNYGYIYYQIILFLYFLLSYILLFLQYRRANKKEEKQQVRLISIGLIISSILAMITDLIFPYLNIFAYTWLGPIFTLILLVSIFIAILRHNLFNIRVIVTEIFSVVILAALLIDVFISNDPTGILLRSIILILIAIFIFFLLRGVYREVNQRERIEKLAEALGKANERLKELDQLKSEFVSLATHQIRGPLTAIKGYISLMLEGDYGEVPKNLKEPIGVVAESSQSLSVIVEDYLNVSRIEQGRMNYDFTTFDLNVLAGEVVNEMKPNIEKKGLVISLAVCSEPVNVNADMGKIKQVIGNLVDNAVKYTPSGSISVSLDLNKADKKVTLKIKDTGIGIKAETIPHLFQKFSRAEDASKANILGTGLGLYVAKEMLKANGGKVWVESEGEGKGSTFFVELSVV
jgi:signal transduction histidine kinase